MGFKKAQRKASKFKGSIQGASGSGKTFSALSIMTALVAITDPGKRIALIDTERSAALYSPPFDFDVDDDFGEGQKLAYSVDALIAKMETARKEGYGGVIIDSGTHFWKEAGGLMSLIDAAVAAQKARGGKGDSFAAWKSVDPIYRKLMNYIRHYPAHVIMCVRAKQAYEKSEQGGKGSLKKVGMEPEFRDGFEFEMDAQFAIDQDHVMVALKHRLTEYLDGKVFKNPGKDVAEAIVEWINAGAPGSDVEAVPPPPETNRDVSAVVDTSTTATTEPAIKAALPSVETLISDLSVAANDTELAEVAKRIRTAKADLGLTDEQYKSLSAAYSKRQRELKGAA